MLFLFHSYNILLPTYTICTVHVLFLVVSLSPWRMHRVFKISMHTATQIMKLISTPSKKILLWLQLITDVFLEIRDKDSLYIDHDIHLTSGTILRLGLLLHNGLKPFVEINGQTTFGDIFTNISGFIVELSFKSRTEAFYQDEGTSDVVLLDVLKCFEKEKSQSPTPSKYLILRIKPPSAKNETVEVLYLDQIVHLTCACGIMFVLVVSLLGTLFKNLSNIGNVYGQWLPDTSRHDKIFE